MELGIRNQNQIVITRAVSIIDFYNQLYWEGCLIHESAHLPLQYCQ